MVRSFNVFQTFPREFLGYRLYRRRFLQRKGPFAAFLKIYKIITASNHSRLCECSRIVHRFFQGSLIKCDDKKHSLQTFRRILLRCFQIFSQFQIFNIFNNIYFISMKVISKIHFLKKISENSSSFRSRSMHRPK